MPSILAETVICRGPTMIVRRVAVQDQTAVMSSLVPETSRRKQMSK